MKVFFKLFSTIFLAIFIFYLLLSAPSFPTPPPDSPQSQEKGDTADILNKKAYFTDSTRAQVVANYENQWKFIEVLGIKIPVPVYRLNRRPEEGKQIIYEQIRTSYLEEIVHPFRESFFINGFVPKEEKDTIIIDDRHFEQKINVRYIKSPAVVRVIVGISALIIFGVLLREWYFTLRNLRENA